MGLPRSPRPCPGDRQLVRCYCGSSLPACSAAMYSAYQSAQFASRTPVRFSCSPCAAAARRIAAARSATEENAVWVASTRPGNREVTSCSSQVLPSGSLNVAYEMSSCAAADPGRGSADVPDRRRGTSHPHRHRDRRARRAPPRCRTRRGTTLVPSLARPTSLPCRSGSRPESPEA